MKTKTKTRKAKAPTPPTDMVVGYIVRYETNEKFSGRLLHYLPLNIHPEDGPVLLLSDEGTLFNTHQEALNAVTRSIQYQIKYRLIWNQMYGNYVIDAVRAPVIA